MNEPTAIVVGAAVSALVPALGFATLSVMDGLDPISALGLLPLMYFFAAAAGVALGGPLFALLRARTLVTWWSSVLSGALVGYVVAAIIRRTVAPPQEDLVVMVPLAAVAGLVFWIIWQGARVGSRHRVAQ